MAKILRKIVRWMVFPSNPIVRDRSKRLTEYKNLFPNLIEHYESVNNITNNDRVAVREMIDDYRNLYGKATESDRLGFTLGQANRFDNGKAEGNIVRLENALRRLE